MKKKMTRREKALRKRRIFLSCCAAGLLAVIAVIVLLVTGIKNAITTKDDKASTPPPSSSDTAIENSSTSPVDVVVSSEPITSSSSAPESSAPESSTPKTSAPENKKPQLDPNFSNLLLVNGKNPLPEDYDYEGNLVKLESKYICGSLNQVKAPIYPYLTAMLEAAWEDGVNLKVLSPYRSYATQQRLFNNKVQRVIDSGTPAERAEEVAATVVARPGTSEHHTGLAIDFNSVEDSFEKTAMYRWLDKNAQDYGFILRYTAEKQEITGVIHESWHWRFVGINEAKKIKASGLCLEEYLEKKK